MISRENKKDFKQRGLTNVKLQIAASNFGKEKHKEAEQWVQCQESPWRQPGALIGIAAVIVAIIGLVLSRK